MDIVKIPNDLLTQVARPIETIDKKVLDFIEGMKKTLIMTDNPKGVGLAAPQVGKSLRIFLACPEENGKITVFINPEILETGKMISKPKKRDERFEGCLSIPNIWGIVNRSQWVRVSYQSPDGKTHTQKFTGFMATIIQHENDHINGILFTQRVLEQKHKLYKVTGKDEDGAEIFEEIKLGHT